jgi:hypothetical protein
MADDPLEALGHAISAHSALLVHVTAYQNYRRQADFSFPTGGAFFE